MRFIIKIAKFLFKLIGVVLLLFIGLGVFIQFSDWNRHKEMMAQSFYQATGYILDIKGNIQGKIFPSFFLSMEDVSLTVEINKQPIIVDAQYLDFNVKFTDLLLGKIIFNKVNLKHFAIRERERKKNIFEAIEMSAKLIPQRDSLSLQNVSMVVNSGTYHGNLNVVFYNNEISGNFNTLSSRFDSINALSLPPMELTSFKAKIDISADKLQIQNLIFNKVDIVFNLDQKKWQTQFNSIFSEGQLSAQYSGRGLASGEGRHYLQLQLNNARADTLLNQFNQNLKMNEGQIDFNFEAETWGNTQASLLENMLGKGALLLSSGTLYNLSERLNHLTIKFDVKKGRLYSHKNIALETTHWKGKGSGNVYMQEKEIDCIMNLKRKSYSTMLFNPFENVITIRGSLQEPNIRMELKPLKNSLFGFPIASDTAAH